MEEIEDKWIKSGTEDAFPNFNEKPRLETRIRRNGGAGRLFPAGREKLARFLVIFKTR